MPNIKFSYLYRDAGNYKNYGSAIFANPDNINPFELETLIRPKLDCGLWFYHHQWQLPDLHTGTWDNELDHPWHEFESVEQTGEAPNAEVSISDLITLTERPPTA